jgi:hypothetical protein
MTAEVCAKQCGVVGPEFHEATASVPNGNGYFDGCSEAELGVVASLLKSASVRMDLCRPRWRHVG